MYFPCFTLDWNSALKAVCNNTVTNLRPASLTYSVKTVTDTLLMSPPKHDTTCYITRERKSVGMNWRSTDTEVAAEFTYRSVKIEHMR